MVLIPDDPARWRSLVRTGQPRRVLVRDSAYDEQVRVHKAADGIIRGGERTAHIVQ